MCSYYNVIYAKYVFQNEFYIANINIDRTKPQIEFIGIDNIEHNNVQNTYEISMQAKFVDQNLKNIFLDKEHIKVKQDGEYIDDFDIEFNKIEDKKNEKTYEIKLKRLKVDGKFKIKIDEGTLIDEGGLENNLFEVDVYLEMENVEENSREEIFNSIYEKTMIFSNNYTIDDLELKIANSEFKYENERYVANILVDINYSVAKKILPFIKEEKEERFLIVLIYDEGKWLVESSQRIELELDEQ